MSSLTLAQLAPLTSDELIQERVTAMVGRAISRQLWLMFLDDRDAQLPPLIPLPTLPTLPSEDRVPDFRRTADAVGASGIIVVLERYGEEALTASDRAWARHIHLGCADGPVRLRGILLSHARGVRWIAPDDYLS